MPSLLAACAVAVLSHSCFVGAKLALSVRVLALGHAPSSVGLVLMASALLPALLSAALGRAADRYGVRPLLLAGLGLQTAAALSLALWPHGLGLLVLAAALLGGGFNAFVVALQKLIGALPPTADLAALSVAEQRKRRFGTLATAASLSSFAGPLLAGGGLDRLSPAALFALLAGLPLCAAGLVLGWRLPEPAAVATPAAPSPHPASAGPWRLRRPLMLGPELLPLAGTIVLLTLASDGLVALAPVMGQALGLSATAVGSVVSAYAVGAFAIRLASGLFIARVPEWRYLRLTLAASGLILLACAWASGAAMLVGLAFLLGAWLGLAQPMTQSLLHQAVPEHRVGEALGARLALVGAAQSAGPLLLGLGAQTLGWRGTLALTCALLLAGAVLVAGRTPRAPPA